MIISVTREIAMTDLRFSLFLAKNGWAVYELATKRVVAVDGIPQAGLKFASAEQAARLLNASASTVAGEPATASLPH
jgi:hypothetical protein